MKVLAIDIGAGTQDILLYDDNKNIENCVKIIFSSPSIVFAERVRTLHKDIFVCGEQIGGGAFSVALKEHLKKGYHVFMTAQTAYTIRNNLDEVSALGIKITDTVPKNFKGLKLKIRELNLDFLSSALQAYNENLTDIDAIAIAVQDHGIFPKGISNRKFRLAKIKEILTKDARLEKLSFLGNEIPEYCLRMHSAFKSAKRKFPNANIVLMDTTPAALLGCLEDSAVQKIGSGNILCVNVGNCHTMAALLNNNKVLGILEHHTRALTHAKLQKYLIRFADGNLSDTEIFKDNGHGMFYLSKPPGFSNIKMLAATGPNRKIFEKTKKLNIYYAAPGGDVMLTGCIGLVRAAKARLGKKVR